MEKNDSKIVKIGNSYESFAYRLTTSYVSRVLHGFFLFKRRKGEIVAGATTFFVLLSFCPAIFLMISLIGFFSGDITISKVIVMDSLREGFPDLAPWIIKSISSIIDQQLKSNTNFNLINFAFLSYSMIGLVSSFMYGINAMIKGESTGGFIIEDIRSFFIGSTVASFLLGLIAITNKTFLKLFIFNHNSIIPESFKFIFKYQFLSITITLLFFTMFYKVTAKNKASLKNSFFGAITFVGCFLAGKSFYWIYLNLTKTGLSQNFGNFYTMVIAALWIYYLVCSFFFGSCVATVTSKDLGLDKLLRINAPDPVNHFDLLSTEKKIASSNQIRLIKGEKIINKEIKHEQQCDSSNQVNHLQRSEKLKKA